MNTIKSLLAASMLSAASISNALTIQTYNVTYAIQNPAVYNGTDSNGDPVSINLTISGTGAGTAKLSETGILVMTLSGSLLGDISPVLSLPPGAVLSAFTTNSSIVLNTTGAYNLNKTSSNVTTTSCANNPMDGAPGGSCASIVLNTPTSLFGAADYYSSQSFALSGGTINLKSYIAGATIITSYTLTAVPLPPSAWLFGSALLGLVGAKRRRKS